MSDQHPIALSDLELAEQDREQADGYYTHDEDARAALATPPGRSDQQGGPMPQSMPPDDGEVTVERYAALVRDNAHILGRNEGLDHKARLFAFNIERVHRVGARYQP